MVNVTLPIPRGCSRKTTDVKTAARVAGAYFVRLYKIQHGAIRAHAYARGGPEGALGPVVGYGLEIEDGEGITVYARQERTVAALDDLFVRATARDGAGLHAVIGGR